MIRFDDNQLRTLQIADEYINDTSIAHRMLLMERFAEKAEADASICVNCAIASLLDRIGSSSQISLFIHALTNSASVVAFNDAKENEDRESATVARKSRYGWAITGRKEIASYSGGFDYILAAAHIDSGIFDKTSLFLVPKSTPGLTVLEQVPHPHKANLDLVDFNDMEIPQIYLLGSEGGGLPEICSLSQEIQINVAGFSIGLAKSVLQTSLLDVAEDSDNRATSPNNIGRENPLKIELESIRHYLYNEADLMHDRKTPPACSAENAIRLGIDKIAEFTARIPLRPEHSVKADYLRQSMHECKQIVASATLRV